MPVATTRKSLTVDVDVTGALRALRGMPKEASRELRAASVRIVNDLVPEIKRAARSRQDRAAVKSVRARSDRAPAVVLGGKKKVTSSRNGWAGSIAFGADAGSHRYRQFADPGRFFWDTLGREADQIMREWGKAYDETIERWGDGRGD